MSPLNDVALVNILAIVVTFDTSHFETSPLNDVALLNILVIVVTFDTSHLEMSPLNLSAPGRGAYFASTNNPLISVTAETSQDPIGPYVPLVQSKSDAFRHAAMAALSSALDLGAQTEV